MKTSDPAVGFILAREPANIKLSDIAGVVATAGFAQSVPQQARTLEQVTQSQRSVLAQYNLKQILDINQQGPAALAALPLTSQAGRGSTSVGDTETPEMYEPSPPQDSET